MAQTLKEYLDEKLKSDSLRAPDRNPLVAPQADLAKKVKALLNKYETKKLGKIDSPWNRYGAGHSIGDLLFGQSPELLDDMSYGLNPLTKNRTGRLPIPDKRLLDMPVPTPSAGMTGVIKNKGGNWLTGSVENALKGLKQGPRTGPTIESLRAELSEVRPGSPSAERIQNEIDQLSKHVPINSWIDNTLTKYVKNRMATPDDEVRKLADQGILHYEPRQMSQGIRNDVITARKKAGFPTYGIADNHVTGTAWEDLADSLVMSDPAGDLVKDGSKLLERNPWLSKVDPNAPVYDVANYSGGMNELVGYDHLIDELLNTVNPDSGLPNKLPDANGKMVNITMTPEGFKSLSMEDAVKKVHAINAHRVREAERERKRSADTIKNYPKWNEVKSWDDGYRLVRSPDTTDNADALEIVRGCGKAGGWCTEGKDRAIEYGSGENRLNVLLDPDGRPVAQMTTKRTDELLTPNRLYEKALSIGLPKETVDEAYDLARNFRYSDEPFSDAFTYHLSTLGHTLDDSFDAIPLEISEIKGLNNGQVSPESQKYLQDFVKSGDWSNVSDLQNTGLRDILKPSGRTQSDNDELLNIIGSRFATDDQINNAMEQLRKLRIKKMFDEQD